LHNNIFRGATRTAQELIANNALHAGLVLPQVEGSLRDAAELTSEPISLFGNKKLLGTATGSAVPGGLLWSLVKVVEHLAMFEANLKANQIILTGSPLPLCPARPGDHFLVSCLRLGVVETTMYPAV
jgi:2-keto-4-pentenoate hydratase